MELAVLLAALRTPSPAADSAPSPLRSAVAAYTAASELSERADAEAAVAVAGRLSATKATLTTTLALERARQDMIAELRLVGQLTELPRPVHLRLCS